MKIFDRHLVLACSATVIAAFVTVFTTNADANNVFSASGNNQQFLQPKQHQVVQKPAQNPPVIPPVQHQTPQQPVNQNPAKPAFTPSPAVIKLKADVADLNTTLNTYIKTGNRADLDLTVVIAGIDMVAVINTDLTNIDHDGALLRDLLGVAKQVPALRDQASTLLSELEQAKPSVKKAQKSTSEANARLIPIRNKLNTIDKNIRSLVKIAGVLEKGLNLYSATLVKVQQCADGLLPGSKKDSIQSSIDNRANEIDPTVVKINANLVSIINAVNTIDQSIQKDTKQIIEPLHKLESDLDSLARKLHALVNPLHELDALYKKEFSAEFPYPAPTFENPFKIKHYKVSIGFKTILQGKEAIEHEIEKMLSKEMYEAAKLFGLEKLIKSIEHDAMGELNSIKNKIHLNINLEVQGLDKIEDDLIAFEKGLFNIQMLDIDTQPVNNLLNKIQDEVKQLNSIFNVCAKK